MDDEILLRRYARESDEAAFRALAHRYGGLVYAACLRDLRRSDLAEDAAQEVFLVLARKADRIRVRTTLVPWLIATARLVSRGVLRAERRRPTVPLDDSTPSSSASTDEALFAALDALNAPEREAVVLRFVQGLTLAEVGRVQGVSEDAARMRVQRALKRLRKEYVPTVTVPFGFTQRLAALVLPRPTPLMTTSLLLASSSVAALAVVGAAVTVPRTPAPGTSATSFQVPVPEVKPFDESKVKLRKTEPPAPKIATLDKPFTLVYRLTITNVRTKTMTEAIVAEMTNSLAKEVDEDRKTQAQADAEIARFRAPGRPTTSTITLAYDGKTLFYEDRPDGGDDPRPKINLFDGKKTLFFWTKVAGGKYGSQGSRETGTVQMWTSHMPYIGPSVPFFPVTKDGQILILSGWDRNLIYRPYGQVRTNPQGVVEKLLHGRFDPQDSVVLSNWKPMHGVPVAGSIVWTKRFYQSYLEESDLGKPEWEYRYTLVSDRPSVNPAWFDPETYVEDRMSFSLDGGRKNFTIDRTKGSLDQQIAATMGAGR